jgi:hypothetical protein
VAAAGGRCLRYAVARSAAPHAVSTVPWSACVCGIEARLQALPEKQAMVWWCVCALQRALRCVSQVTAMLRHRA